MCPDRDLVSAYVDGEVPSPWRERLEEHLRSCPECAALAARYAGLGERLRSELPAGGAEALARGGERLDALLASALSSPAPLPRRALIAGGPWRRSVRLPLPLAAAAAILVLLLGGSTAVLALRQGKASDIRTLASAQIAPPAIAASQPASMEELLQYLNAQGGEATITIKLPTETTFGTAGNPVIMRTVQPVKGTTVGGRSP
jgi:anti-sigma factor RsiW